MCFFSPKGSNNGFLYKYKCPFYTCFECSHIYPYTIKLILKREIIEEIKAVKKGKAAEIDNIPSEGRNKDFLRTGKRVLL
jgi:hypothetical protein